MQPPSPAATIEGEAVVEAHSLEKRFAERLAVAGIDLAVPRSRCFGLLGPNGAGKTTTLRMAYGVTRPTAGRIHVFGLDVARHRRRIRARLGVALQDNVLIEALTPVENLRVFARYHLLDAAEAERRIAGLVEFLHLGSHRDVPVRTLSGGFQRRVAIALALVARPELLILDEPTTGLDPAVRRALWNAIHELQAAGTTVLMTTHYMEEAERLCDRIAVMAGGRVLAEGEPGSLIARELARETVEVEATDAELDRALAEYPEPVLRTRTGRRSILHTDDATALAAAIRGADGGDLRPLVVRPTNLEDLFLHLTGASLEGGA